MLFRSVPADSSKIADIERLVREVSKETDHVDILFANAGATWGAYFDQVDEKNGWDKVMDLNVKGVFFTIQKYVFFPLPMPCELAHLPMPTLRFVPDSRRC